MKNYNSIIDYYYSDADYYFMYSGITNEPSDSQAFLKSKWEDKSLALEYLDRFYLFDGTYRSKYKEIQYAIFNSETRSFPEFVFLKEYLLFPILGGLAFVEEDFRMLKMLRQLTKDNELLVIMNNVDKNNEATPPLRFKFPLDCSWSDLMSGGVFSTILFEMPHNDFFVFGDAGKWGKYVANDLETPLDIWGVLEDFVGTFGRRLVDFEVESQGVMTSIPTEFKNYYNIPWLKK